ncbi:FecR family protein [Sinomicrobium pectinilyticum]|uniref:FecR family protein n=1 Tax=Sinomicrobium pectinilyticum TaxID=1084421 RepID=A0A3N0EQR2_SINP1|nr:FecR family protein [Sinomicrobium pectinilyticum]RNL90104.1 FecR family protein [Sinomicrobium pectinilyticum]
MKYLTFDRIDFAADDYFIQWVHHPDAGNNRFWCEFLADYPYKQEEVKAARTLVLGLSEKSSFGSMEDEMWKEIQSGMYKSAGQPSLKKWYKQRSFLTAVTAACILGIGFFFINNLGLSDKEAMPPEPQITLQLQDGSKQAIDESATRTITTGAGRALGQQNKQVLVYKETQQSATELAYNELTVPYGKTFELVLSDGSHIYLNAGSMLRYPVQFLPGQPRDVFLDGEAFFEVAKDNTRPFTVVTDEMNTRVYGTKFNVTSYKNEGNTYTVLAEGSVGVYKPEDKANEKTIQKIVPGQKANFENQKIVVEDINVYKYTAWTSGELYFLNDRFDIILRKLERHYNVKINNTYKASEKEQLTSSFKEGDSLELVLGILKKLQPFNYERSGNTITITPP